MTATEQKRDREDQNRHGQEKQVLLVPALLSDARELHGVMVKAFLPTLAVFEDEEINPALDPLEKVQEDILAEDSVYYKVVLQGEERIIGGICVWKTGERVRFIAPVFIDPVEQRKHCGTEVLRQILEGPDPFGTAQENPGEKEQALTWKLTCTLENGPLMHFYENMGFRESGERALVNEKTTLALLQQEKVLDQAGQIGNNRYMPGRSCGG